MSLKENNRLAFFQTSLRLLSLVQFVKCRQIFMDWYSMLIILSCENKVLTLLSYLMTLYKFKRERKIRQVHSLALSPQWACKLTDIRLLSSCRYKHRNNCLGAPNSLSPLTFNAARNKVVRRIEKAKKEAVINEIDNSKLNSRVLWKTLKSIFPTKAKQMSRINSLTKEGTSCSTPEEISNVFNEYFISIADNIIDNTIIIIDNNICNEENILLFHY